jgi:hypothetical protein
MFRNGGYPIAINTNEDKDIEYVEDLQVPQNAKMYVFMCIIYIYIYIYTCI